VSSALSLIGGVHIGARALRDVNLIWFGSIARLSQWGGGGYFTRSKGEGAGGKDLLGTTVLYLGQFWGGGV
jgi:hypothetical protein